MDNNFLFTNITDSNTQPVLQVINNYAEEIEKQFYVIDKPLIRLNEQYNNDGGIIILTARHKIIFLKIASETTSEFDFFVDDIVEDIGHLSDTYSYKSRLGRPREWKEKYVVTYICDNEFDESYFRELLKQNELLDEIEKRDIDFLISLFTGSINDIAKIGGDIPINDLEIIKKKIIQFDTTQTNFIYSNIDKKEIVIQGLSGTGKTELLLHKLRELYVNNPDAKIVFTCHNKILADKMVKRIPEFFDFMKVDEQIKWEERLWCFNAWGSKYSSNSGLYAYICAHYGINFYRYSYDYNFDVVCKLAIKELKSFGTIQPCFNYILIDESQDFSQPFFELCKMVTKEQIYIAGDIFQNVFGEVMSEDLETDFLLNKCYRTDPKTLMFAHGLSMALFEKEPLRWLDDKDWENCGYSIETSGDESNKTYTLSRVPISRFEDIETKENIIINEYENGELITTVINVLKGIRKQFPTVVPDDIAVVFLNNNNDNFKFVEEIEPVIHQIFNWEINAAYESKATYANTITFSNKNNVKGLEFPFVICVSRGKIMRRRSYRNSVYMLLTRSFLQSYFLIEKKSNTELLERIHENLKVINEENKLIVKRPANYLELQDESIYSDSINDTIEQKFDKAFKHCGITEHKNKQKYKNAIIAFHGENISINDMVDFIENNPIDW